LLSGLTEREIKDRYPGTTVLKSGTFNHDQNMEFEIFKQKGIYNVKVPGEEDKILVVWKYVSAFDPEFTDIKGIIISDYQEYIENNWVNNLRTKYPVKMNKKVLKKIYRRYEI
jgi:peptidyl-prolyl cis-trans isomerase SurA